MSKFLCNIKIVNTRNVPIYIINSAPTQGQWTTSPSATIGAQGSTNGVLDGGDDGAQCTLNLSFTSADATGAAPDATLILECAKHGNTLDYTHPDNVNTAIQFASPAARQPNQTPGGQPLEATFTIMYVIESISAVDSYPVVNLAAETVDLTAPIWKPDIPVNDSTGYSTNPAVFSVVPAGKAAQPCLSVSLNGDKFTSGKCGKLILSARTPGGSAQYLGAQSDFDLNPGPFNVSLFASDPTSVRQFNGTMEFTLFSSKPGNPHALTLQVDAQLELYWLFSQPGAMWNGNGVWVWTLRDIFVRCGINSAVTMTGDTGAIPVITTSCFNGFNGECAKHYESGAPMGNMYVTGGTFPLQDFYIDSEANFPSGVPPYDPVDSVNCYDMSAFLQVCLGAVGIQSTRVVGGFGFFATADLIGWGPCNNPAFRLPWSPQKQVCDEDDPLRSWWSDHSFLLVPATDSLGNASINGDLASMFQNCNIADACGGPHTGSESPTKYYSSAVDSASATTLYGKPDYSYVWEGQNLKQTYPSAPATEASIHIDAGNPDITSVGELPAPRTADAQAAPTALFEESKAASSFDQKSVRIDWKSSLAQAASANSLTAVHDSIMPGPSSAHYRATFKHAESGGRLRARIFVERGGAAAAAARFRDFLRSISYPSLDQLLEKGPAELGPQSLVSRGGVPTVMWMNRNVFGIFVGSTAVTVLDFAKRIYAAADAAASEQTTAPALAPLAIEPHSISVGDYVTVRPGAAIGSRIHFSTDPALLRLVRRADESLTFKALGTGRATITVVAADPKTLVAASASGVIEITSSSG